LGLAERRDRVEAWATRQKLRRLKHVVAGGLFDLIPRRQY
ncbi:hypothetical protein PC115_g22566, partial [Phytophthora cactorum]